MINIMGSDNKFRELYKENQVNELDISKAFDKLLR